MRRCNNCKKMHDTTHHFCPECRAALEAKREAERQRKIEEGFVMTLVDARKERGLLQKQMARKLGIATQSYARIEEGKKDAKPSERRQMAALLQKTVKEIWPEPYRALCRKCRTHFETDRDGNICPDCVAKAQSKVREKAILPGDHQAQIAMVARRARKAGMTYGQYVAREYERGVRG